MSDPSLVLGTAGHIDHGKSALVKALTGTDPDRLAEEKRRGITIELGFASLTLPSGRTLGIVDVPGHERFVRQMVAGATGIDLVLLVVAADDGVMPQTREHLAVIDLLGIDCGVVAVTKSDLADDEWVALVVDDIHSLIAGTSLEDAPIVPVSAKTGEGLPDLLEALDRVAGETSGRTIGHEARLPIDRVFTISGAGTVVTGTLWCGTIGRDQILEVLPGGQSVRVRSVEVHGQQVDSATAGHRVAVNLSGAERSSLQRGDVLAEPGSLSVTDRFDAVFTYLGLEGRSLSSGARVHVHHGTREVLGRILLMDGAVRLEAGSKAWAQFRLEEPLAPRYGDRFIVRSYSPVFTIGGGEVLDVSPPRRTVLRQPERDLLEALAAHDVGRAAVGLLRARGLPMTAAQVAGTLGVDPAEVARAFSEAGLARLSAGGETHYADAEAIDRLVAGIERGLREFHDSDATATGIAVGALRDVVDRRLQPKVFDAVLRSAVERGAAVVEKGEVRHPQASSSAVKAEVEAIERIGALLEGRSLSPPTVEALASQAGIEPGTARKALTKLVAEGRVVRLGGDMHFAALAVEHAREAIVAFLAANGTVSAGQARDALGTSRKFVVPLLEYFDAQGITRRDGDVRTLRQ